MKNNLMIKEPEIYFDNIHRELDNFLNDTVFSHHFPHPIETIKNAILRPAIEITQCNENYKVKVQLPGVKKEDIEVELDNDFMTITAETKEEKREENEHKRYYTSEFRYGQYQRTISFDQPVKAEDATADYKNGILTITIPKEHPQTKEPRKLTIKTEE